MTKDIVNKDHIQGNVNAPVELIEYGDYECPYCKEAFYAVKKIQQELGDNLKFIFRNFPLVEMHPYALHAAIAAEVAGAHGKFWEMNDLLYENQDNLEDSDLLKYAKDLNINGFSEDFEKYDFYKKIENDYNSGIEKGVQGTPAFFVNGKMYESNWMTDEFIHYLKSLIK